MWGKLNSMCNAMPGCFQRTGMGHPQWYSAFPLCAVSSMGMSFLLWVSGKVLVQNVLQPEIFWEVRCETQATIGMLSLNSATCFSAKTPYTPSITSHSSNMPTISRSELVMLPVGFPNDIISFQKPPSHFYRNTVGMHSESSPRPPRQPHN
jgi:hypothetical protein